MKSTKLMAFFLLIIIFTLSSSSLAYPGEEGSCLEEHGITCINIPFREHIQINIDGSSNDPTWNELKNETVRVPLASDERETEFYVVYMNLTTVLDASNIYILCTWNDTTTVKGIALNYDGLFFCWNISVPQFSAEFWDGMDTIEMGGGKVDSWTWDSYNHGEVGEEQEGKDMCFSEKGWLAKSIESQDIIVAYTFKENQSYTVEIRRKLQTNDEYDVQFDKVGEYLFNMGVVDNGYHQDHAISWTYLLNITELGTPAVIPGFSYEFLLYMGLTTSLIIITFQRKHKIILNAN